MPLPYALLVTPLDAGDPLGDMDATLEEIALDAPAVSLGDAGLQRGDGIFETIGVVDAHAQDVTAHLERFAQSAALCDLPRPHAGQWRAAIARASARCPQGEAMLRLTLSRGGTAWIVADAVPDHTRVREEGVRVVTLDRGIDSGVPERAPWLLLGAKTLSYAVNMAALREARRRGADDVVFVASDGVLLEGPTSSVVLRLGDRFVTPRTSLGILRGTTQLAAFAYLEDAGFETAEEILPVAALADAEAAWLLSSVRLAVPVRAVDGVPHAVDAPLTAALNAHLLARRG